MKRSYKGNGDRLLSADAEDRTSHNNLNIQLKTSLVQFINNVLTMRMVQHWNRLTRDVLEPPSLDIFKCRVRQGLSWNDLVMDDPALIKRWTS